MERQATFDIPSASKDSPSKKDEPDSKKSSPDSQEEQSKSSSPSFAELIPLNPKSYSKAHYLSSEEISLGRGKDSSILIDDKRLSSVHCKFLKIKNELFLLDCSRNGTFLNDVKLGSDQKSQLFQGDRVHLLHKSRVKEEEAIGFIVSIVDSSIVSTRKRAPDEESKELAESNPLKKVKTVDLSDGMKCCICLEIIYQCVTLIDCLHNVLFFRVN